MNLGDFGKNLKAIRTEQDLLQVDIAKNCGLSTAMVCMIEKGFKEPSLRSAKIIADYLGVSLDELMS